MPEAGVQRAVAHRERDDQSLHTRTQPVVAEQRRSVDDDRGHRDEREVLVQVSELAPEARALKDLRRHRQPDQHRQ